MDKFNVFEKFNLVDQFWTPKIIAELNGQQVRIAKLNGDFIWHAHEEEDELFYVLKGDLHIYLKEKVVHLSEGDMFLIPKGVEHKPEAKSEVWVMLFEPAKTKHTGNRITNRTVKNMDKI